MKLNIIMFKNFIKWLSYNHIYFGGLGISLVLLTSQKKGDNKNGRHVIIKW